MTARTQRQCQMIATFMNNARIGIPCRYFNRRSGCWKGHDCHYQHIRFDPLLQQQSTTLIDHHSAENTSNHAVDRIEQRLIYLHQQFNKVISLLPNLLANNNRIETQTDAINRSQHIATKQPTATSPIKSPTITPTPMLTKKHIMKNKEHASKQKQRHKIPSKISTHKQRKYCSKQQQQNQVPLPISIEPKKHTKHTKDTTTTTIKHHTNSLPFNDESTDYESTATATDSDGTHGTQDTAELNAEYKQAATQQTSTPPSKAEIFKTEGNNYFKQQNYNQAISKYQQAVDLDPDNPVYPANIATALYKLGHYPQSLQFAIVAAEMDPYYIKANLRVGLAAYAMENWNVAKQYLNISIMETEYNKNEKNKIAKNELSKYKKMVKKCESMIATSDSNI